MTTHDLKTWPTNFQDCLEGRKPYTVRVNDRNFQVDDFICKREWDQFAKAYTGRELTRRISCITRAAGAVKLPLGHVVLGLEDPGLATLLGEAAATKLQAQCLAAEQGRLGRLLFDVARILGVKDVFGAIEEEALLTAAKRVVAKAGEDARLVTVLDLMREAHQHALRGSGPKTKECLGEGTRLLAAVIDGRA